MGMNSWTLGLVRKLGTWLVRHEYIYSGWKENYSAGRRHSLLLGRVDMQDRNGGAAITHNLGFEILLIWIMPRNYKIKNVGAQARRHPRSEKKNV